MRPKQETSGFLNLPKKIFENVIVKVTNVSQYVKKQDEKNNTEPILHANTKFVRCLIPSKKKTRNSPKNIC